MNIEIAEQRIKKLMSEHGLTEQGWTFKWSNSRTQLGACYRYQKVIRISRSMVELNGWDIVKDITLHEIAHTLAPASEPSHGTVWKQKCHELGCTNSAQRDPQSLVCPPSKYIATCPTRRHEYHKNKKGYCSCGKCSPNKFKIEHLLIWKEA